LSAEQSHTRYPKERIKPTGREIPCDLNGGSLKTEYFMRAEPRKVREIRLTIDRG